MYGDLGHGTCLFLLGCYLLLTQKRAESRNPGPLGVRACLCLCLWRGDWDVGVLGSGNALGV